MNKTLTAHSKNTASPITGGQYSLIRIFFGLYIAIHFIQLLPYGSEIFSTAGVLSSSNSPLLGILPNPLHHFDTPFMVSLILSLGAIAGILLTLGYYDRIASFTAALILAWLYARNPLIANPSMPVVGWMLIAHCFVPAHAYGSLSSRNQAEKWLSWFHPREIWFAAWILLAVAYSYSGYTKLFSPSWVDGSAIRQVLENPLARDHFIRVFLLDLNTLFLQILTWGVLILEILFLPLCLNKKTRQWAWTLMLLVQCGFLVFLNFADLTFPMFLIHALTFDSAWVEKYRPKEKLTLFYDGTCAFCNNIIKFCLAEDVYNSLTYSPLQNDLYKEMRLPETKDDSIVLQVTNGDTYYKSDAAIHILKSLGGMWTLLGLFMSAFPKTLRNSIYDIIGKLRYRISGKVKLNHCKLLPSEYSRKIIY